MDSNRFFLVRVSCMTYNQHAYITDAMNGFVMQQTDFPFVCSIVDDASTDGEQNVIRNYVKENFELQDTFVAYEKDADYGHVTFAQHKTNKNCYFAVIYLKENHYSQKKSKAPYLTEWNDVKYIALCEGDDYWTDSLKLQKQVDFLESHPEYDMVCARFSKLIEDSHELINKDLYDGIIGDDTKCPNGIELVQECFLQSALPQPCTVMYHNGTMDGTLIQRIKYKFDIPLYWCYMYDHKVWLMNERMAVYRVHAGSVSRSGVSDIWNIYAAYLDILQYDSDNPVLRKLCASGYRSCYAIPAAYEDDYSFSRFVHDLRKYISHKPSIRNLISYVIRVIGIRIRKTKTE